jgi:CRISPR-associated endonuclease/helicase Cas3
MEPYSELFAKVTGRPALPYQLRLNESPAPYTVLSIPTGLGKTDAVLVDWLARRPTTRLIWCLPGRALTRQVAKVARERARRVSGDILVLELMGGNDDNDYKLAPDQPAILVGTQDILISRALNRGYARSPFRWPIDFALLNNDAQWVFDEVQLLGDALASSTQLAAFRSDYKTFGEVPCVWMSATLDRSWLQTVDFDGHDVRFVELDAEDRRHEIVRKRLQAPKHIQQAPPGCRLPKGCAEFVAKHHSTDLLTLVIANTVERATEIRAELRELDPVLLHSRFRPADRAAQLERVLNGTSRVVISTQVIEAGIDLDAGLLVTDIAPWPSLVQRFGRVNRFGEKTHAEIYWVDRPLTTKKKSLATAAEVKAKDEQTLYAPYEPGQSARALAIASKLTSAAPADLPPTETAPPYSFVLRRADLLDLFDTTPDLTGNQLDVSRFVRSGKESDVYLAWRNWPPREQPPSVPRICDGELCAVPLNKECRDYVKRHGGWVWRHTRSGGWEQARADELYPGMLLLFRASAGGYDPAIGWRPALSGAVPVVDVSGIEDGEDAHRGDWRSAGVRVTLAEHSTQVVCALRAVLEALKHLEIGAYRSELELAARKHDWGKAHPVFQQTLHGLPEPPEQAPELLAKQDRTLLANKGHSRQWFRHELASAVAMIEAGDPDLAAYVAAAHHGKVRLNIRSMPGEAEEAGWDIRVARGIRSGERLFAADLGDGTVLPETPLSLASMELGASDDTGPGWTDRVLGLLEREGPFRLAFLEMLLRVSDERASSEAENAAKEAQ